MRTRPVFFGLMLLLPFASAHSTEVFVAEINGARTFSPATGFATFRLREDLSAIDYFVTYENLSSPEYMAHVHRPDDTIAIFLPLGTPKVGTWLAPTAQDIAELRNEELYVNIHSEYYPTGEIRGTLRLYTIPVASTTWGAIKALYR